MFLCQVLNYMWRADVCFFIAVDAGHRAVIFDRFRGVQDSVVGEGTHFLIPWVQKPIIFDCRSRPRNVPVITGSKGTSLLSLYFWYCFSLASVLHLFFHVYIIVSLCITMFIILLLLIKLRKLHNGVSLSLSDLQNVNITLRILFRPVAAQLPRIFTSIGEDYDERVLPSITTEVLKAVVVSVIQNAVKTCLVLSKKCQ